MYIVNCYVDTQEAPCMMQAFKTITAAQKRADKARKTFSKVVITITSN